MLDIHVMVNWGMSKQSIRWPVSGDHIAGFSWELIEVDRYLGTRPRAVSLFLENPWGGTQNRPGTGFRLDRRLEPS